MSPVEFQTPADEAMAREEATAVELAEIYGQGTEWAPEAVAFFVGGGLDPSELLRRWVLLLGTVDPLSLGRVKTSLGKPILSRLTARTPAASAFRCRTMLPDLPRRVAREHIERELTALYRSFLPPRRMPVHEFLSSLAECREEPEAGQLRDLVTRAHLSLPERVREGCLRFACLARALHNHAMGGLTLTALAGLVGETKAGMSARNKRVLGAARALVPDLPSEEVCAKLARRQKEIQATGSNRHGGRRIR